MRPGSTGYASEHIDIGQAQAKGIVDIEQEKKKKKTLVRETQPRVRLGWLKRVT